MKRRTFVVLALVLAVLPSVAFAQAKKIVIDPGHGGMDPGGTGTGMEEKVIVLDVSKRFKALLDADTADAAGGGTWTALLTRSDDTFVSLAGRSAYANSEGADRFMSIHSNAFSDPAANGTETFSFSDTGQGAGLRNLVQEEVLAAWGLTNRGNKTANFAVLRDTAAPAELHELAFITNATDAAKLASPTERQKAAIAHLRAIQRHFGIPPYVPTGPGPTDQLGEIAGRVIDELGPVAGAMVQLDSGESVVTPANGTFVFIEVAPGARVATAFAEGHESKSVDVAVAAGVRADTEIELVRLPTGDDPDPTDDGKDSGCHTGRGTGGGLLGLGLGLAVLGRRRGRR
jgi:N-acetylmuramoyl-L-alanine amidase